MLILELTSNITLRLFLRPFEAVLSLKSLFERVPGGLQGSYFVWRAKMRNYYHLESSLEAVRPILKSEAARGRSSDLEPPRPPYMILRMLNLTSASDGLGRPRTTSEVQNWGQGQDILRSGQGIWVSYTGGLGGLRSLEWPQAASDWKRGRTASKFFEVATIFNFSSSHKICAL